MLPDFVTVKHLVVYYRKIPGKCGIPFHAALLVLTLSDTTIAQAKFATLYASCIGMEIHDVQSGG
jgi:hypothetical protein